MVNVLSVRFVVGSPDQGAEDILPPYLMSFSFLIILFFSLSADHKNFLGPMVRYFFHPTLAKGHIYSNRVSYLTWRLVPHSHVCPLHC